MSTGGRLGLVVVEYRDAAGASNLLRSLDAIETLEIVVVSTGPKPFVATNPRVRVVHLADNPGFGAALNVGVRMLSADTRHFIISNTDIRCTVADVTTLWAEAQRRGLAAVAPTITDPDGKVYWDGGRVDFARLTVVHDRMGLQPRAEATMLPASFVTGAFVLLSRDAWKKVGGMREDFFLYGEDADFSLRLHRFGLSACVYTGSRVVHRPSSTVGQYSPLQVYLMARNNIRLFREWSPRRWSRIASWMLVPGRLALRVCRRARRPWRLLGWVVLGTLDARERSRYCGGKGRAWRLVPVPEVEQ